MKKSIEPNTTNTNNLQELIAIKVYDALSNIQISNEDGYLTRHEVTKLLKISLATLHNWTNKGYLKAYQIGGRVYYKHSEIESSLTELKPFCQK
ncbi:helix-turn-helix domain-containing protein [Aegicerativicinus sediminis]|uniref:helix-turn-helix domain-containing protein n=1 Tax=Aegicerativicinus sediminis TaxID=2893202 RepID=UPI001E33AF7E|nr:helix-turn-helix domain-containing protein [Aegicerativicinus sediminis]